RSVAQTFDVLSVSIWLVDEATGRLVVGASTASQRADTVHQRADTVQQISPTASTAVQAGLLSRARPFDLEEEAEPWMEEFRGLNPATFETGGHRWCVPLRSGERSLGALVLADRVGGHGYSAEELELLTCIGDQVTSVLLNLRLADEVARGRELEAFRLMSTFFI